jgi:hypothetical protein
MALTLAAVNLNPAGGGTAPAARTNLGALKTSLTSVTVGVAGDYPAGGIVLTAAQLGLDSFVLGGWASVQTAGGAGTISQLAVVPQSDGTIKLKANALTAESAGAGVAGAVILAIAIGV